MKFSKSKTTTIAVSLFLMFAMAVSLFALPAANAQGTRATFAFIGATPNPIGIGQETLLHIGITHELAEAQYGWEDLTVTVTKPDGTTETLGPFRTDATGGTGYVYVPDEPGNYTLQTHFPEQKMPVTSVGTPVNTTMLASDSEELTLVVQEEPVPYYSGHPLPTEYWTRPIDAQLREWYTISGSWLAHPENKFAPYNDDAPETAHVLWTKPLAIGGLVGGELGLVGSGATSVGFEAGDAYEGKWGGGLWGGAPMIIAGRLYYQEGGSQGLKPVTYHCVDLHTGEELWAKTFLDNKTIAFGQLFYFQSFNYQGTFAYLWVITGGYDIWTGTFLPTIWYAFDAFTGDWRFSVKNVPSGTTLRDEKGGLYILQSDLRNGWMALWNMTALVQSSAWGFSAGSWGNVVHMQTLDAAANTTAAKRAWSWNVTIPKGLPGSARVVWFGDRVVGASINSTHVIAWGLNLNSSKGAIGGVLFNEPWRAPAEWLEGNLTVNWGAQSAGDGVFTLMTKETRQHFGFSAETGKFLWATELEHYLNMYTAWGSQWGAEYLFANIAYGKLFSAGMAGIVYCYDVTTGDLLWTYKAYDPYAEILWSNNWPFFQAFVTDGKIYLFHSEHSPNQPLPRGAPFICLNATTGEEVWRADGLFRSTYWGGMPIIGDSIIAMYESYDQRIYAIGKGPSATTVTASPEVSVHGSSVLVKGMVTDISPGTEEYVLTARFPNGVPAVSDENMSDWMLYVYKQFARPADVVGVEVVLEVLDPNNNFYEVGRTTSDASGMFSCAFTPEVPGKYTIIASFEGSGAYYGSFAETAINVEEAPAATPAPTPTPAPMTDMYVTGFGIGIIIAIAVVGLLLFMIVRRR